MCNTTLAESKLEIELCTLHILSLYCNLFMLLRSVSLYNF